MYIFYIHNLTQSTYTFTKGATRTLVAPFMFAWCVEYIDQLRSREAVATKSHQYEPSRSYAKDFGKGHPETKALSTRV